MIADMERTFSGVYKTGIISVYKTYVRNGNVLVSPNYQGRPGSVVDKPGEIVSDRTQVFLYPEEVWSHTTLVAKGIHVYLNQDSARKDLGLDVLSYMPVPYPYVIVEAQGDCSDLVAVGRRNERDVSTNVAVFTKIRISEKEWEKVFGNKPCV